VWTANLWALSTETGMWRKLTDFGQMNAIELPAEAGSYTGEKEQGDVEFLAIRFSVRRASHDAAERLFRPFQTDRARFVAERRPAR
jgi:hypothetical protein